jgi:hypothetical protein
MTQKRGKHQLSAVTLEVGKPDHRRKRPMCQKLEGTIECYATQ